MIQATASPTFKAKETRVLMKLSKIWALIWPLLGGRLVVLEQAEYFIDARKQGTNRAAKQKDWINKEEAEQNDKKEEASNVSKQRYRASKEPC